MPQSISSPGGAIIPKAEGALHLFRMKLADPAVNIMLISVSTNSRVTQTFSTFFRIEAYFSIRSLKLWLKFRIKKSLKLWITIKDLLKLS